MSDILWSKFTLRNYSNLKKLKKININKESIYYKNIVSTLIKIQNKPNITFKINNYNIDKKLILQYCSVFWVWNGVLACIDELDKEYIITWNNNKILLKCTSDKFIKIKKRLPILLKIINYIKKDNQQELNIYLVLSNLKKKYDNSNEILPKHINSGYTDIIDKYIFIWREEEFEKVLFHELIHFFDCDHRDEHYSHYSNHESLYEAITDVKGITFNFIYLALLSNNKIHRIINYEFSFIHNQGVMINNLINKNIKLVSPAFSYYVLKSMLIKYITSSNITLDEYNDIFIKNKNFNLIINKFDTIKKNKYYDFNTCRMTFFELE